MSPSRSEEGRVAICPECGAPKGSAHHPGCSAFVGFSGPPTRCPSCGVAISPGTSFCPQCGAAIYTGGATIHVQGTDASEVERVARRLAADERDAADRRTAARLRSPW